MSYIGSFAFSKKHFLSDRGLSLCFKNCLISTPIHNNCSLLNKMLQFLKIEEDCLLLQGIENSFFCFVFRLDKFYFKSSFNLSLQKKGPAKEGSLLILQVL